MIRRSVLGCLALAGVACSDHRYGFFGDEEGSGGGGATTTTTGPEPTDGAMTFPGTVPMPTTVDPSGPPPPTTLDPSTTTTLDPSTTTTFDPTTGPGTITIMTDPSATDPTVPPPPQCGEVSLGAELPVHLQTDNSFSDDFFSMPCVGPPGTDVVFTWSAPHDGTFRFDTVGSAIDTVLTVFGDFCGGPVIGCNDDTLQLFSQVDAELFGGSIVTVAVEGLGGQVGPIALNITEIEEMPDCGALDLGSELVTIAVDTQFGANLEAGSCGGSGSPEAVFEWRAPFAGQFRFRTFGSNFDPVLYIRSADCKGFEVACNDDFETLDPQIELFVGPDDGPLFLFVDGLGGSFGAATFEIAAI